MIEKKAICNSFLSVFGQRIGKAGKHRMQTFGLITGKGKGTFFRFPADQRGLNRRFARKIKRIADMDIIISELLTSSSKNK